MTDTQTPPETTSEHYIRDELTKVATLIDSAHKLMMEGRSIDLSAVESRVCTVTEAIVAAPPEIGSSFKEHLSTLLEVLNNLQTDLEAQHKELENSLNTIKRRVATDAYATLNTPSDEDTSQESTDDES